MLYPVGSLLRSSSSVVVFRRINGIVVKLFFEFLSGILCDFLVAQRLEWLSFLPSSVVNADIPHGFIPARL